MSNNSNWPTDRTLLCATTRGQIGPGKDCNERVLRIHQSSSITRTSPWDCLVSYPEHSLGEYYLSAEKQSVYSAAPANKAKRQRDIYEIATNIISKCRKLVMKEYKCWYDRVAKTGHKELKMVCLLRTKSDRVLVIMKNNLDQYSWERFEPPYLLLQLWVK